MEKLKGLIFKHSSLLIMAIGSVSIFLSNIILKDLLSAESYGVYSIFITYVSIISSFGLLGFEQVFLRITDNSQKDTLVTDSALIAILIFVWLIFGFICAFLFDHYFFKSTIYLELLVISTLGISLSMFLYNVFRINSNFFVAQLFSNYWKIALFLISISILLMGNITIEFILNFLVGTFLLFSFGGLLLLFRKIDFKVQKTEKPLRILLFAFQFFISLLTLSIIGQGDKLFIEKNFGLEKLGEYFYLANIFIFPFSMLQSYVGFKELVNFKKSFSKQFFLRKIKNINLMGLLLSLFLLSISWIGSEVGILKVDLNVNLWLVVVFLMIGISKLNYA